MKTKQYIQFCFLLILFQLQVLQQLFSQDIHFSQFYEAPLLRNPSLAGIYTGDIRVQAVYRDQWNSVTNAYRTGSLNAEYKLPVGKAEDFLTVGLQMLYDKAGTVSWVSAHILPALNYHKSLSAERNMYLSMGFMGGFVQRSFDRTKMTTNSQYDGLGDGENLTSTQYRYIDAAAGLTFNTQLNDNVDNNMFVGAAYHHFNKPKNSFYRDPAIELDPKWVGSAGIKFSVTPASYITLQGDYSTQGRFRETVVGALYGVKIGPELDHPLYTLHGGAFLRVNDALIPALKIDYNPFAISLSYDINISKLKTSSYGRGGFELGVSYIGFVDRERSAINALHCPRF
ncbi:MAG: PorP/SprF family type IX secretion system membrane protein [Chitinophagaceae bacterium]